MLCLCGVTALAGAGEARIAQAATTQTVVTLTFDHGLKNQMALRPLLQKHGMHATFFVNSGHVGSSDYFMTWNDIHTLAAEGHEIGGHTLTHADPAKLTIEEQRREVCDDRNNLLAQGFAAANFAYPYGSGVIAQAIVQGCGYNSARGVGASPTPGCGGTCAFVESIPPLRPYRTRTAPHVAASTSLDTLKSYVLAAEAKGGWVQFVVTDICAGCYTNLATMEAFLDWLATRKAQGTVVKTVRDVIGGAVQPVQFGSPLARDTVRPIIASLGLTRKRFAVGSRGTAVAARRKRGTVFLYTLSEPGKVTITIQRKLRRKRGCRPARRSVAASPCIRYRSVGTLKRNAVRLSSRTAFSGRIGRKALRVGRYRAVVTAVDSAGNSSQPRSVAFTLVRP